jgi:photosystem II stability/assembly factor-like uncharacterized protein
LFYSSDYGKSWNVRDAGITDPYIKSIVKKPNGVLFAGTYGGGVFRSTTDGDSWEVVNTGLSGSLDVRAFWVDPNGVVYTGLWGSGTFRSTNDGANWEKINEGLHNTFVNTLAPGIDGYLLVGTYGSGSFRSIEKFLDVADESSYSWSSFKIEQNYPNPFLNNTTVRFSLTDGGITSLKVFDVLGNEKARMISERLAPGSYERAFDGSDLAAGTYFFVLEVDGVRKIVRTVIER